MIDERTGALPLEFSSRKVSSDGEKDPSTFGGKLKFLMANLRTPLLH